MNKEGQADRALNDKQDSHKEQLSSGTEIPQELTELPKQENMKMQDLQDQLSILRKLLEDKNRTDITDPLDSLIRGLPGDTVEFGTYPQGANGETKPVLWRILEKDDESILLVSEYSLDQKPYHNRTESVSWKDCSLRKWLNTSFFDAAFTPAEKTKIRISDPDDKVFLLSIEEARKYLSRPSDRQCRPTDFARSRGAVLSSNLCSPWWLKPPAENRSAAAVVYNDGCIANCGYGVDFRIYTVRPVIRIRLKD